MRSSKYHISKHALLDIEDIWIYTFHKWSKEQADRYYQLIFSEIDFIAENFIAENFMAGKSIEHIRKGYRVSKVKSHLIFYRKNVDEVVEIIRVLHQRMDVKTRLR